LPGPWLGQELSCHGKFAKGQRQKTMEACALAGRPGPVWRGQEFVPVEKLGKGENLTREMFGVITNLSRPAEGNYICRLLGAADIIFKFIE
jgi:hypothetical protein